MNIEMLFAFGLGMVILAATPGPGVLSAMAVGLSNGFRASLYFISGLVLGDISFFLLALIGMSTISLVMGQLFFVIKIIGGIYLIWLGVKAIRQSENEILIEKQDKSGIRSFTSGLLVTMGNPKAILFYASIVPTIIDVNRIHISEVSIIVILITAISFIIIGLYCRLAIISQSLLKNQIQNRVKVTSGLVMIGAGTYILLKKG